MKPRRPGVQDALLYVGAWLPFFAMTALILRRTNVAPHLGVALYFSATYTLPGVLVGALLWLLARRLPWRRLSWPAIAAIELGFLVVFVAAWESLFIGFLWLVAGPAEAKANASQFFGWQLMMLVLVAAVHSAAFHVTRVFGSLRDQEVAAAESEALRVRAEMQALRGQLDPHFLFNSLHSITALVREDPARAEEALLQFAGLLRRVLDLRREAGDEVTLADELRFADDYLAIERLRLGERLRLERHVDDDALACSLPAFTVQPLLENALRHAVAPRRDGGTVTLRATVAAAVLTIEVADNGPGSSPDAVANATGVGLAAIRQRLALRYGEAAAMTVDTRPGDGFRVRLTLPAHTEPLLSSTP